MVPAASEASLAETAAAANETPAPTILVTDETQVPDNQQGLETTPEKVAALVSAAMENDEQKAPAQIAPCDEDDIAPENPEIPAGHVKCAKCQETIPVHEAVLKGKQLWWCRGCNCVNSTLRRHLQWPPTEFNALDSEAQLAFWKSCKDLKNAAGANPLRYERIKDVLVTSLTTSRMMEIAKESKGEYLPLSVYQSKPVCAMFLFFIEESLPLSVPQSNPVCARF